MRYFIVIFFLFLMTACTTAIPKNQRSEITLAPGKVALLRFPLERQHAYAQVTCGGQIAPYYRKGAEGIAYIAESYYSTRKNYVCYVKAPGRVKRKIASVRIVSYDYPKEKIQVAAKRVFLSQRSNARVKKEQAILNAIYAQSAVRPLFNKPFKPPLTSKITSYYGTQRILNDRKPAVHLGNDLRAPMNFPIKPANQGRVVFAGNLFYTGNEVIIDHGLGIFTTYGHLNKINVKKGDLVDTGTVIGYAGKTGRVTGPHLHWGTRIQNHVVDGFSLVQQSQRKT